MAKLALIRIIVVGVWLVPFVPVADHADLNSPQTTQSTQSASFR